MPRSRSSVKRTKAKVVRAPIKKKHRNMPEPVAGKLWKEKGTVRGNYAAMGLAAAVNQDAAVAVSVVTRKAKMDPTKSSSLSIGTGQLQVAGHLMMRAETSEDKNTEDERAHAVEILKEGDQEFVERLLAKYKPDQFDSMSRDKRINVYQHTPAQIRKKVEKYMKLKAEWERGKSQKLPNSTWNISGEKVKI